MTDSLLSGLVGLELSSVVFVADYLQLDFGGPCLSVYVWPQVVSANHIRGLGDPGYRDALCDLIGRRVTHAGEPQAGLMIAFDGGRLVIAPTPDEVTGAEIAMLRGLAEWMVWRPGETPFTGPEWGP